MLVLLQGQLPPHFPLTNSPFLCLTALLSFLRTCPTFWCRNPGGKIHCNWVGSSHKPTSGGPLPWTLPRNWDELWDRTLHCLAGLTSTYRPTFHSSVVTMVSEIPFSQTLSLASFPSPGPRRPHGPRALGLVPHLILKWGRPFQADYSYSLRRVWEQGCLSSQTFLLTFSCPCLPFLFGSNGKFSIPTLKIYSSWMPSPKPKSLGLPRGD